MSSHFPVDNAILPIYKEALEDSRNDLMNQSVKKYFFG